ncbi:MAG: hypothetical protein LBD55_11110 [Treponema sp.]|nr:hypothetical protein [Treponema sp.]
MKPLLEGLGTAFGCLVPLKQPPAGGVEAEEGMGVYFLAWQNIDLNG